MNLQEKAHPRRFASRVGNKETSQEKDAGVQYARHNRAKLATPQPPSLPRNLLGHFEGGGGIWMPSRQLFTWTLEGNSKQVRRLHHHLILRHLDVEDDLHQWRRSIGEMRNLDGYTSFFTEVQAKQIIHKHTRQSGESNSNKAHKEYLAHIYADRTPQDYERVKQALKKDLRHPPSPEKFHIPIYARRIFIAVINLQDTLILI